MGHNSVVLGYPKFTGIPRVDGLSTGPSSFGASQALKQWIHLIEVDFWNSLIPFIVLT